MGADLAAGVALADLLDAHERDLDPPEDSPPGTLPPAVADTAKRIRHRRGYLDRGDGSTHCRRGHERTDENTYTGANGRRRCRVCMIVAEQERKARRSVTPVVEVVEVPGCGCLSCVSRASRGRAPLASHLRRRAA